MNELSPTFQLLLRLSHPNGIDTAHLKQFEANQIDWEKFLRLANAQHLSAQLFKFIRNREIDFLPPQIIQQLEAYTQKIKMRNLFFDIEFERIQAAFVKAKVDIILLKGFAYIKHIYQNFDERFISDIDILISKNDLNTTRSVFRALGYRCIENVSHSRFHDKRNGVIHAPLQCDKGGVAIDLHTRLGAQGALINELAWQQIVTDGGIRRFSTSFMLLHHCFHFAKHLAGREGIKLQQIQEISRFLERMQPAELELFQQLTDAAELSKEVTLSFQFLTVLYPGVHDMQMSPAERLAIQQIIAEIDSEQLQKIEVRKGVELNAIEKIGYLFYSVFPTKIYLASWHAGGELQHSYLKLWLRRLIKNLK